MVKIERQMVKGRRLIYFSVLLLTLVASVATVACDTPAGIITVSGSTTVQPISERLSKMFMVENPRISVVVTGGGSGVGIKDVNDGKVDIGASSRELTNADPSLVKYLLARDGIAIIVNKANPVPGLTKMQVRAIFAGNISDWHDVGGQSTNPHVIARIEGSGTRASFQDMVMGTVKITSSASVQESNESVLEAVAMDVQAIGFISFGYVNSSVKALPISTIPCVAENIKNGTYPIVRPLYYLTRTPAQGQVKKYIDFCLTDSSQKIIASEGYFPAK